MTRVFTPRLCALIRADSIAGSERENILMRSDCAARSIAPIMGLAESSGRTISDLDIGSFLTWSERPQPFHFRLAPCASPHKYRPAKQVVMRALFGNYAILEDDDLVCRAKRGHA